MTQQIGHPGYTQQPPPPSSGPHGQPAAPYGPPPPARSGAPQPPALRRRTGAIVAGTAAAVIVIAGLIAGALFLFGSKLLDTTEAETEIARITEEQFGLAPSDVSCPDDVPLEAGTTTTCTGTLDGQPVSYTVEQTEDEGDVWIASVEDFVVIAEVEAALSQQVGAEAGVKVTTTCDAGSRSVLVDGFGTPIPCTVTNATDATDNLDVLATVDEAGDVTYEVA
ncbi:protein of unknown function [Geodermatophilus pulveris]|uniref:DUF4333 domain-containing protein n=1 Tax=Geodermatophilus pulveris TaxID=1564159 RepID=A0A239DXD5_9ACTN|nr:DUF4333 domain-containing protein [Geodermatophilus pulveris]SNS36919.1 protein of unknown function [Geodermatophilus pulveris]